MSSELIFVTGATGFIGAATALEALKAGYRLRISVRKEAQIKKLKSVFSEYLQRLDFVVVPDITSENAFAGKLEGVDYVLHLASPFPSSINKEDVFPPAVNGTISILKAAASVPSIKRVVITSSILALKPLSGIPEGGVVKEDNDWDFSVDESADFTGENNAVTAFRLYEASKLLANKASWKFMGSEKPHFSLITIHPSFVYGHNILQTTAEELKGSTNGLLFNAIMNDAPMNSTNCIHVQDVADAHIKAFNPAVKDNSSFMVTVG
ncbi:putative uncharacterized oxidoreductase [Lachnellula suecica]|uniref:Uncharacterized oxidoreductase n=1 Tax=Lachnellula suecica TaxID=602035 RepID=A0A8T9CGH3_9HELO|nr:putative uncharacterized oxidoreductase [Lachnellula suecica]